MITWRFEVTLGPEDDGLVRDSNGSRKQRRRPASADDDDADGVVSGDERCVEQRGDTDVGCPDSVADKGIVDEYRRVVETRAVAEEDVQRDVDGGWEVEGCREGCAGAGVGCADGAVECCDPPRSGDEEKRLGGEQVGSGQE
eukprot:1418554-Rhodomonas_salina.1